MQVHRVAPVLDMYRPMSCHCSLNKLYHSDLSSVCIVIDIIRNLEMIQSLGGGMCRSSVIMSFEVLRDLN